MKCLRIFRRLKRQLVFHMPNRTTMSTQMDSRSRLIKEDDKEVTGATGL